MKKQVNIESLAKRQREINNRLDDLNDGIKAGKREATADESAEMKALEREYAANARELQLLLQMREAKRTSGQKTVNQLMREMYLQAKSGGQTDFALGRAANTFVAQTGDDAVYGLESVGITPVELKEVVDPLEMECIYGKLGISVPTGVHGKIVWPCLDSNLTCTVASETVALSESALAFSKVVATPVRVGLAVTVTNSALEEAGFDFSGIVLKQLGDGLARLIDKTVISSTAAGTGLAGPFTSANTKKKSATFAATYPTYAELLQLKGKIAGTGVKMVGFAYVMNATTYATLEATPIDSGSGLMIIQNGKIAGYPVFVTDDTKVADGTVRAGVFGYEAVNVHGDLHLVIDPYTKALNGETMFVLNADLSATTIKGEVFGEGKSA